jgi:hypothetical protein
MTVSEPYHPDLSGPLLSVRSALFTALTPLLLALFAGTASYLVLGATTGLFFAGIVIAALLIPPLTLAHADRARQLVAASAVVDGVAVAWLFAVTDPAVSLLDWVRAYLLLVAWGLALWGVADLLARARLARLVASALTVFLALAWLAWPVWLSPWIAGRDALVGWLVPAHPLLSLDGALRHLGPAWTERHLMYTQLTVLNQDVFYALPAGVARATLFHAALGMACLLPYRRLIARRRAGSPAPAAGAP